MAEQFITTFTAPQLLPPQTRRDWENRKVRVRVFGNEISIQKADTVRELTWDEIRARLQQAGKQVTEEDLQEAIRSARANMSQ